MLALDHISFYIPVFPHGCLSYYGPHQLNCLVTIWHESGCVSQGSYAPEFANPDVIAKYNRMDIR